MRRHTASASVRRDGMHEDLTDPEKMATSTRMPTPQDFADFTEAYRRLSPHPDHFEEFLGRLSSLNADLQGWSDERLAGISAPTLLVIAGYDPLRSEGEAYGLRLSESGVTTRQLTWEGLSHGFFQFAEILAPAGEACDSIAAELRALVSDPP